MFVPATRRVVMAPAHAQPGSGSVVERDDLVVGIDERHNRGEDGGPRARVKPGGAVAQIARALIALVSFRLINKSGVGPIIQFHDSFRKCFREQTSALRSAKLPQTALETEFDTTNIL